MESSTFEAVGSDISLAVLATTLAASQAMSKSLARYVMFGKYVSMSELNML